MKVEKIITELNKKERYYNLLRRLRKERNKINGEIIKLREKIRCI